MDLCILNLHDANSLTKKKLRLSPEFPQPFSERLKMTERLLFSRRPSPIDEWSLNDLSFSTFLQVYRNTF